MRAAVPVLDADWLEQRRLERVRESRREAWALHGDYFGLSFGGRYERPRDRVARLYAEGSLSLDELERYMELAVRRG